MAEFLIKAIDATNPDPEKDARACYKRGDIVQIYRDGTCWEPVSRDSPFVIVKCPEISYEDAKRDGLDSPGENRRRRFSLNIDALPQSDREKVAADKLVILSQSSVLSVKIDKGVSIESAEL